MRLRTDFWVAAYLRTRNGERAAAVLRRRGAPEAGAVLIKLDRLDGRTAVFGPVPQAAADALEDRCFIRLHRGDWIDPAEAEALLRRETGFDPDLWIVEVDDAGGDPHVTLVPGD